MKGRMMLALALVAAASACWAGASPSSKSNAAAGDPPIPPSGPPQDSGGDPVGYVDGNVYDAVEVLAGAALAFSPWMRLAAGIVASLQLAFMAALVQAAVLGLEVSCGCFGVVAGGTRAELLLALVRDVILLGPTLWLVFQRRLHARSANVCDCASTDNISRTNAGGHET